MEHDMVIIGNKRQRDSKPDFRTFALIPNDTNLNRHALRLNK